MVRMPDSVFASIGEMIQSLLNQCQASLILYWAMEFPAPRGPQVERPPIRDRRTAELESYEAIDATIRDQPARPTHPVATECWVVAADICRRLVAGPFVQTILFLPAHLSTILRWQTDEFSIASTAPSSLLTIQYARGPFWVQLWS
ncbi:hypothetical protein Q7P37_009962 [Cladosporium fusiforme]